MISVVFIVYVFLIVISVYKKSLPLFFVSLAIMVLYIGQAYYMLPELYSGRVRILDEYGYTILANDIALLYLILLGLIFLIYLASAKEVSAPPPHVKSKTDFINVKLCMLTALSISLYISIVGFDGIASVRPNLIQGGTFGTTVILATALLSLLPILCNRINPLTIVNILANFIFLVASGTRIYVIYFLFTLGASLIKAGKIKLSLGAISYSGFVAFCVLILGQSIKEYFGGNVNFDDLLQAIEFTAASFYLAQTEAFVSFASVIQIYLDRDGFVFNLGGSVLDGFGLLLPGFVKNYYSADMINTSSRFYNYSIIPSAANDLFQAFFVFGIIIHFILIYSAVRLYRVAQSRQIVSERSAVKFILRNYIVSVLCVLFTRGPIDLLIFSIVPVYVVVNVFLLIVIKSRVNRRAHPHSSRPFVSVE